MTYAVEARSHLAWFGALPRHMTLCRMSVYCERRLRVWRTLATIAACVGVTTEMTALSSEFVTTAGRFEGITTCRSHSVGLGVVPASGGTSIPVGVTFKFESVFTHEDQRVRYRV